MHVVYDGLVIDPASFRVLLKGREVLLERRAFDLLLYLYEHRTRVVSKEELLSKVWGARMLSDGVLSNTVAKLRKALGQRAEEQEPIKTVYGRGYCLSPPSATSGPAPQEAPTPTPEDSDPFVGRQALMSVLIRRLEGVDAGLENILILTGEAGIGKTRTAQQLVREAGQRNILVLHGSAYGGGGAPPYWPWVQILRAAYEELSEPELLPGAASALAQLLPELGGSTDATSDAEPQRARFRVFDAVGQLLRQLTLRAPLLISIDDLQDADSGSVELLNFVAAALTRARVLFLVTLRTGELPMSRALAPLEQLARASHVYPLPALSLEEVAELTRAITGDSTLDPVRTSALHARTNGNPLFIRHAVELILQRGDWSVVDDTLPHSDLPPAIRHLVRRRVASSSSDTRRALEAAAVVGNRFEVPLLAEVLGVGREQLLDALEPALKIGVLNSERDDPDGCAFSHALVRDSLYDGLSWSERGALHGRIAVALSRRELREYARQLGELAHHYLHALPFRLDQAMAACLSAASAAQQTSGFEVASALLLRALHKLDGEQEEPRTRVQLLLALGENHFYAGSVTSAFAAFRDAAQTAHDHDSYDLLNDVVPRLVDCLEIGVGDERFARRITDLALSQLGQAPPAVHASLLAQRAELAVELPVATRLGLLDDARQLAERSGCADAVLEVAHSRAILRNPATLDENDAAVSAFFAEVDRFPEAAATMRYRSLRRFGALLTRYLSALTRGDLDAADAVRQRCRQIAEESHVRAAIFVVQLLDTGRALGDARLADARSAVAALSVRPDVELPVSGAACIAYWAALLEAEGKDEVLAAIDLESKELAPTESSHHGVYRTLGRAHLYARRGDIERVQRVLAGVPDSELARMPVRYGDLGMLCVLAELCVATGDRARGARTYTQLAPHAARNAVGPRFEYYGAVEHYLGLLAVLLTEPSTAREHFVAAIACNRKLRMPRALANSEAALRALSDP